MTAVRIYFFLIFRFGAHKYWTTRDNNVEFGRDKNYKRTYTFYAKYILS